MKGNFPELEEKYVNLLPGLFSAVLCDVLDGMGYWNQAMSYQIQPLQDNMTIFGRAFTVLAVDVHRKPAEPYKLEIEAVDKLTPGDVMVASTNGSTTSCFWGELLSISAQFKGASGVVVDGLARDAAGIIRLGFPVFAKGRTPADSLGRIDVIDYQVPIKCGGVLVNPGDYIFGDMDGVCVIPREIVKTVFEKAEEKVNSERDAKKMLESGMTVTEMWKKLGIL